MSASHEHDANQLPSDVLVLGAGLAGMAAALAAADRGAEVVILLKGRELDESNTFHAQGGIIGPGLGDSPEAIAADLLRAGCGTNYLPAVQQLANLGPGLVQDILIDRVSVPFTRDEDGGFDLTLEAAHTARRILHVEDRTGQGIVAAFTRAVLAQPRITIHRDHTAIDLITTHHHSRDTADTYRPDRCLGCYALATVTGKVRRFLARNTILATGGAGQVYLHTTNPRGATGDGLAMACRSGATIVNSRFVQFHPTTLSLPGADNFLLSESLRGEGARLLDQDREPFMQRYAPEEADLAPRDVVARAIYDQITSQDLPFVYLDIARYGKPGLDIAKRFPHIYEQCLRHNLDLTRDPIPVVPAAHYFCGGVLVDLEGRTTIEGLFAVGEVACTGLHGANRLASASLLEALVWGTKAGRQASLAAGASFLARFVDEIPPWTEPCDSSDIDPVLIHQDWLMIKHTLWNYAGIVRTRPRLHRAHSDLQYLSHRIMRFYHETRLSRRIIELRNGIVVAKLIVQDALEHPQSDGCHFVKP